MPDVDRERAATILYTSGTTSDPKGVVATHRNVEAQVESLVEAWGWSSDDYILNHLPLHHVHGIINAMSCALWVGATCELLPRFDAQKVWSRIVDRELTLYMAVPTVYKALISEWEAHPREWQLEASAACSSLRLMVSGSDALPVDTFERWEEISGHRLLERYGMTEIGMALSNPLHGDPDSGSRRRSPTGRRGQTGRPRSRSLRGDRRALLWRQRSRTEQPRRTAGERPQCLSGVLAQAEATRKSFTDDAGSSPAISRR